MHEWSSRRSGTTPSSSIPRCQYVWTYRTDFPSSNVGYWAAPVNYPAASFGNRQDRQNIGTSYVPNGKEQWSYTTRAVFVGFLRPVLHADHRRRWSTDETKANQKVSQEFTSLRKLRSKPWKCSLKRLVQLTRPWLTTLTWEFSINYAERVNRLWSFWSAAHTYHTPTPIIPLAPCMSAQSSLDVRPLLQHRLTHPKILIAKWLSVV